MQFEGTEARPTFAKCVRETLEGTQSEMRIIATVRSTSQDCDETAIIASL